MTYQEKLDLLEDMMELEENTLSGKENLEDIDEWDSMSKLYLVSWVKKNMKKKLTTEEKVSGALSMSLWRRRESEPTPPSRCPFPQRRAPAGPPPGRPGSPG